MKYKNTCNENTQSAIDDYKKAISLSGDPVFLKKANEKLLEAYISSQTKTHFNKALKLVKTLDTDTARLHIGCAYLYIHDEIEKAKMFFKGLETSLDKPLLTNVYEQLAEVAIRKGRRDEQMKYLDKQIALIEHEL